jgi:DNA-binding GntR family transcriptional regulator
MTIQQGEAVQVDPHDLGSPSLERPNLKDMVARRLREMIFTGQLHPGSKVDQDEMAAQLGVSKLPVREALIALESEGLIDNIPRRGAFVAPLSRDDVRDHYNLFGLVSGLAAERAATRLSDEELDALEGLAEHMARSDSAQEQEELNFRFHRLVNLAGGSRRLRSVLRLLGNSIPARFFVFAPGWSEVAEHDHRRILDALRERDPDAARRAVEHHLRDSADHAVRILEERGFWQDHLG